MKKILVVLLLFMPLMTFAQLKAYPVDAWHSNISFSVKFGRILPVKGTFNQFSGTIMLDENDLSKTSATIRVDAKSINTGVQIRDNHLRSEEFFEVEKYSQLSFSSTEVYEKEGAWHMKGNLTMHGVTREVDLVFDLLHGEELDNWKNLRVTFMGSFKLNRLDFGVGDGQAGIGEEVTVDLVLSGRIFNTDAIALFKRPFGQKMTAALKDDGIDRAREAINELNTQKDKDLAKAGSFEFLYLKMTQELLPEKALEALTLYTERFPEDAYGYSLLSYVYHQQQSHDEAKKALQKALMLDPQETLAVEMRKLLRKR